MVVHVRNTLLCFPLAMPCNTFSHQNYHTNAIAVNVVIGLAGPAATVAGVVAIRCLTES